MRGAEDTPLAAGTVVDGRYRVIAELGVGGMGRVYEAEHMFIRRRMALKLLRGGGGPEAAARMVQEATLAGQVPHPAVVRVFDCAALPDGQVYVAMELLRGETLAAALARGVDAATALAVLAEVARGLAAVHRVGVVHRDIKPANVFLQRGESGVQAKLLDFGVAKALPGTSELAASAVRTQAGEVLGTPYYVAPEQIRGGAIDGRADLYSLGVMLYEALTGSLPFVGESFVAILAQHSRTPPLDPRQAAPGREIPDGAARLAMRLLEKDPAARLQDGDAVADAIAGVLEREGAALRRVEGASAAGSGAAAVPRAKAGSGAATVQLAGDGAATGRLAEAAGDGVAQVGTATVQLAGDGEATGRLAEAAGDGVAQVGTATVRLAGDGATVGTATVRLAGDEVGDVSAGTSRVGRVSERAGGVSEGAGASRVSERTGGVSEGAGASRVSAASGASRVAADGGRVRTWVTGGVAAALGVAAVVWFAGGPRAGRSAVGAVEAGPAGPSGTAAADLAGRREDTPVTAPAVPAVKPPDPAPAVPAVKPPEPVPAVPAAKPAKAASKPAKKPRDGGTTRPATPAKTGGPELKPDVYDDD